MKKRLTVLFVIMAMLVTLVPTSSFAATKSATAYDTVIKSGNYVYCNDGCNIYKFNLNDKTKKRLTGIDMASSMRLKNGYLYFISESSGTASSYSLYRIKNDGTNRKYLKSGVTKYAFSSNKIYYRWCTSNDKAKKGCMKLNGSSKKSTSTSVSMKHRDTNNSDYYLYADTSQLREYYEYEDGYEYIEYEGMVNVYLVTPEGMYLLDSVDFYEFDFNSSHLFDLDIDY